MDPDRLQAKLRATFLGELEEHVRSLTTDLLALEKAGAGAERSELLQRLFRTVHSVKGSSRAAAIDLIEAAAARMEQLLAEMREGEAAPAQPEVDLLLEAVDAIEEAGQRLRERRALEGSPLAALVPRLADDAEPSTERARGPSATPAPTSTLGSVRLSTDRLDRLHALEADLRVARHAGDDLVAQLAAIQDAARRWDAEWSAAHQTLSGTTPGVRRGGDDLARTVADRERARIRRLLADLDRLGAELGADRRRLAHAAEPLADEIRALRMVPFGEACAGLERAARDLARAGGKAADVAVYGEGVMFDRAIVEALRAPLLHLVRNAIDHGIEAPAERIAAGKPERGRITVSAVLRGGQVEIAVEDDGRGLDLGAIRARAQAQGLADDDDPRALARLVFLPGFTTARMITDVSGRGVGLDAVRAAVEGVQGSIDVETREGSGTRFVLVLPLTLLALRALILTAGGQPFAIPASHLRRLLSVRPEEIRPMGGRETVSIDGAPVPLASLAEVLGATRSPAPLPHAIPLVVVAAGGRQVALAVDQLVAEQEIEIRGLGARIRRVHHFAGSALLPSGDLALIVHVPEVVATALGRPGAAVSAAVTPRAPARRRRVVLVDDSVTTRTLERSILEAAGYAVAVAADGEEGWALLEREGADALVADVEMPRMDGFALTEAVRRSRKLAGIPVILVTAREGQADRARGLEVGANAYLVKSTFDQRNLLETLDQLLG